MKVYIPNLHAKNPKPYYMPAGRVLPIRPYREGVDFIFQNFTDGTLNETWLDFSQLPGLRAFLTFETKDFDVLETTELTALELAVWGIE